eukprot:5084866-Prymnesium_polylepis.1
MDMDMVMVIQPPIARRTPARSAPRLGRGPCSVVGLVSHVLPVWAVGATLRRAHGGQPACDARTLGFGREYKRTVIARVR